MEKKMNRTWLFLLMVAVIAAAIVLWLCIGKSAGGYSGGILIEMPGETDQVMTAAGEWL
ncbi:MAG: hypothetical protein IJZ85_03305 [Lachnospiraceae bacterium]|nr:hypothetical protein [Lachnospiraceae bacterium]